MVVVCCGRVVVVVVVVVCTNDEVFVHVLREVEKQCSFLSVGVTFCGVDCESQDLIREVVVLHGAAGLGWS